MEHMFATYDTSSQSQEQEQEQQVNVSEPENTQHEDEEEEVEEDDKFEEMEDLGLICAVCMEPYDLPPSMKTPKALPCLHTFCLDCCNSLSRVPHSHFRTTTIACPQCRKVSPLPSGADGLPSNYALLSIIKRAPSSTSADLSGARQAAATRIDVSVSDPVTIGSGLKAFTSFKVCCQSSLPQFANADTTVRRRYNDFVWLHSELWKQYPARFIPALPHPKNAIQNLLRLQPEFVEDRRKALHHFLRRVAVHPVLGHSKTFRLFLEANGKDLVHTEDHDSILNTISKWTPVHHDPELEQMWRTVDEFEAQLAALRKSLQKLRGHRQEFGSTLADLGWALLGLGKHDHARMGVEKSGESWEQTGRCCQRVASAAVAQNDEETASIVGLVEEWGLVLTGAKEALRARAQAAAHYQRLTTNCDHVRDKTTYVNKVGQKVREAKAVSDMMGQRVRAEMALMERYRRDDVKRMAALFASLQRSHAAQVQTEWTSLQHLVGHAPLHPDPDPDPDSASPDPQLPESDAKLGAAVSPRKLQHDPEDASYRIPQEAAPSKCG
mmetsp:Transcript_59284/g.139614  ORF Transcript_59284/g.139614 Transcript_59284/m.139614 type:complete len:553 (-) Transcript_59284:160-1818(-)